MFLRVASSLVALLGVLGVFCSPVRGEESDKAEEALRTVYGEELKRVAATRTTADDVALAVNLLEAAKVSDTPTPLLVLLCKKAWELGLTDPKGLETALAATDFLVEKVPQEAAAAQKMALVVRRRQFDQSRGEDRSATGEALIDMLLFAANDRANAGDFNEALRYLRQAQATARAIHSLSVERINTQLTRLTDRQKVVAEVGALKERLKAEPTDRAARLELIRRLVELDDPAEAGKFLDEDCPATWRKYVPAAARKLDEVPELACLELADWYGGLSLSASGSCKAVLLARACAYYQRFLNQHTTEDTDHAKVALLLKKTQADLDKMGGPPVSSPGQGGQWVDLLRLADPLKNALGGKWQRTEAGLADTPAPCSRVGLAAIPPGDYEAELTFVRTQGGGISVILPVGNAAVMLVLGTWENTVSGLDLIRGKPGYSNETTVKPGGLENGHVYTVGVRVSLEGDQATLAVTLDGKPYLNWKGPQSALSLPKDWALPGPRCLGVGAEQAAVVFQSARLHMLTSKAVPARLAVVTKAESAQAPKGQGWIDALKLVDPIKDTVAGKWEWGPDGLTVSPSQLARITVPLVPQGSYEVEAKFVRTMNRGAVDFILPVGSSAVMLFHGYGSVSGLTIHGEFENDTSMIRTSLENGREYTYSIKVAVQGDQASIMVSLDGNPYLKWQGPQNALSIVARFGMSNPKCLGLATDNVTATFKSLYVRMLSGTAQPIRGVPARE
jgi:chorismate mutase